MLTRGSSLIFMLFVFRFVNLTGQEINVIAKFDTSRIYIGDQINFSVVVEQPSRLQIPFPLFRDTLVKNIEILSGPIVDTTAITDSLVRITGRYLVTSFDSGFYMVNPVYVELRNEGGVKRYYSDYSILEVARVKITPPDTASKIFDIVGPYKAPLTLGEVMPWNLVLDLGPDRPALAVLLALGQPLPTIMPIIGTAVLIIGFLAVALWRFKQEEF